MNLKKRIPLIAKCLLLISINFALPATFSSAAPFSRQLSTVNCQPKKILSSLSPVIMRMYSMLLLDSLGLSKEAFREAVTGYQNLVKSGTVLNNSILSIVDFSLPSFKKRLFVLDMENGKLLFNTLVAHGRNSGKIYATRFSNRFSSFESSLGFYVTGDTYYGSNGFSLRLLGMEQGFNSNALSRGIVIHSADYVNEEYSKTSGRLGRSEGCPAIPEYIHRSVIETIKNGSCFFVYGKDKRYAVRSKLLKSARLS
jgi:hypothetical protein